MDAYIQANAILVYAIVMIMAALLHWGQKVRKGEVTGNFMDYWFTETPGYSLGTFGAIAGTLWLVYTTNGLDKMASHMVIEGAFATGWAINSAISPGSAAGKVVMDARDKAAGFIRLSMLPVLLAAGVALMLLSGCGGPMAAKPATVPEGFEASDRLIEKISNGLVALSCGKFVAGNCIEPGKPLMPKDSLKIHERAEQAHAALQTSALLGAGQLGDCLGEQRTQAACATVAMSVLTEIDAYLISLGSKQ